MTGSSSIVIPAEARRPRAGIQKSTVTDRHMRDGYTKRFFVYIMANKKNGTLYVGMTSFLARRANEHLYGEVDGFTRKYGLKKLVYYEEYDTFDEAMRREKRLKRWNREWKLEAIEKKNPNWEDLYSEIQE